MNEQLIQLMKEWDKSEESRIHSGNLNDDNGAIWWHGVSHGIATCVVSLYNIPFHKVVAEWSALKRLEYIRDEILAEHISWQEITELEALAKFIPSDDILLREWAGITEGE